MCKVGKLGSLALSMAREGPDCPYCTCGQVKAALFVFCMRLGKLMVHAWWDAKLLTLYMQERRGDETPELCAW